MSKSINASDGQESPEKAWWYLIWGPVDAYLHEHGMYKPHYSPEKASPEGINSQDSTKRAIQ